LSRTLAAAALVCAALAASPARAQPCPASLEEARPFAAPRVRLIGEALHNERPRARLWFWSWTAAYAALTVGQAVPVFFTTDRGLRADLVVGAASSALALGAMVLLPPEIFASADTPRTRRSTPAG
jgi:hypothetical protein